MSSVKNSDVDRDRTGGANPQASVEEQDLALVVTDVVDRQEAEVVKSVPELIESDSPPIDPRWTKEMAVLSAPVLTRSFRRGGFDGYHEIEGRLPPARAASLSIAEWIDSPEILQAVKNESFDFAARVDQTLADALQKAMHEGLSNGEPVAKIAKRVEAVYDEWKTSGRALMIARTETARAHTLGQIALWKEAGTVELKVWDAAGDACPFCHAMHGTVIAIGDPYWPKGAEMHVDFRGRSIGMKFGYSDIDGPPLHPNCRCSVRAHYEDIPIQPLPPLE